MRSDRAKNLVKYVFPAILTNTCIFPFTIIDGVFVGHGVGTDALGAVNIAMPFVMIATALNMLTSIGGVTIAAIRLGRGDKDGTNQAFMHALTANFALSLIITLLGTVLTEPLCRLLGADAYYLPMFREYVFWWALGAIPSALSVVFQSFCRNDGSPMLVAAATAASTLLNIFLDWLLVFPLRMGVMGAALATGISQAVSFLIVLKKGDLRIRRFKPEGKLYRKVIFRGLPEMIAQFATPVSTICMNHVLVANLGELGVNAFAVISYVASFSMSVLFGASEGLQPLFGQAYGAKHDEDLKYYLHRGMLISLVGSILCTLLAFCLGRPICALFGAEGEVLDFIVKHMPEYAWGFIIAGLNTLLSAYPYSTKRSVPAIVLNTLRSFVFSILVILGLPAIFGSSVIWFTYSISECLVLISALVLTKYSERNGIVYR